jgi:hypothetical protein
MIGWHLMKIVAFALCFAVILASSADAGDKAKSIAPRTAPESTVRCRGANLFHCGPIYNGLDYLGDDPDPFIRLMIQRDLGAKYGGSP